MNPYLAALVFILRKGVGTHICCPGFLETVLRTELMTAILATELVPPKWESALQQEAEPETVDQLFGDISWMQEHLASTWTVLFLSQQIPFHLSQFVTNFQPGNQKRVSTQIPNAMFLIVLDSSCLACLRLGQPLKRIHSFHTHCYRPY